MPYMVHIGNLVDVHTIDSLVQIVENKSEDGYFNYDSVDYHIVYLIVMAIGLKYLKYKQREGNALDIKTVTEQIENSYSSVFDIAIDDNWTKVRVHKNKGKVAFSISPNNESEKEGFKEVLRLNLQLKEEGYPIPNLN